MLHIQTNRAQSLLLTSPPPHAVGRRSAAVSMVLLVVLAWLTLLIFNATLLVVPVSVGRSLLFAIPQLPVAGALKSNGNDCTRHRSSLDLFCGLSSYVWLFHLTCAIYLLAQIFLRLLLDFASCQLLLLPLEMPLLTWSLGGHAFWLLLCAIGVHLLWRVLHFCSYGWVSRGGFIVSFLLSGWFSSVTFSLLSGCHHSLSDRIVGWLSTDITLRGQWSSSSRFLLYLVPGVAIAEILD